MSLLLRAGYWTHGVGKMHFRGRSYGFRNLLTMEEGVAHRIDDDYLRYLRDAGVPARFPKGFRDLLYFQPQTSGVPVEHSASNWVADRSVEFLHEHARYRSDQPFFLWSSWIAPHPPFAPSEPYDELYDPAAMPLAGVPRPPGTRPSLDPLVAPRPPRRRPPRSRPHAPHPRPLLRPDRPGRRRHRAHHGGAARAGAGAEHGSAVYGRSRRDARRPRPVAEELPLRAVGARTAAAALAGTDARRHHLRRSGRPDRRAAHPGGGAGPGLPRRPGPAARREPARRPQAAASPPGAATT